MTLAAIIIATACDDALGVAAARLPYADAGSLVEFTIEQITGAGVRDIEVVLGCEADSIVPLVSRDNVEPVIAPRWDDDLAAALRAGASAVPRGTTAALLVDVRQPRHADVIRAVLDAHLADPAPVTRASHEGTPGAPAVIDERTLEALRNVTVRTESLDDALARYAGETRYVEFDTPAVLLTLGAGGG